MMEWHTCANGYKHPKGAVKEGQECDTCQYKDSCMMRGE